MKKKVIRHWVDNHPHVATRIIKIQSLWKGFYIRFILKLAGKGVLTRSLCHNEEEMVTIESKTEIHPLDYFSIEQDGKVWWFDQKSMIEWSEQNLAILNPFNRQELSRTDTRRLRRLRLYREHNHLPVFHSETPIRKMSDVCDLRWRRIVQIINEYAMKNIIHPNNFIGMLLIENADFITYLVDRVKESVYTLKHEQFKTLKYYKMLKSLRNITHTYTEEITLNNDIAGLLLRCLNDLSDPTDFVFFILAAMVDNEVLAAYL